MRAELGAFHAAEEDALRRAGHGVALDPLGILCTGTSCPAVLDGLVVYCDAHHLAATYGATLERYLTPFLTLALQP